ncbi:uncharacterized protein MONOS_6888 [Monocercomonoides exilis]|uniref:uncharacterized protein n=1 Tax=Monocercomonoides exilis TaxID=2049356 RepID=UPI003559D707|nr:hypothetical protein MONOS_6888 [Monocercomonoides exilis]|eukprot:MONOS_6888.1-p1 / transcript=MONOS_6888.1 / gene=MONOS_6888 / organism=Monocercomonoides_exilis_PA203 / gene_product=unspecified product / transcript_product=unspecified product / location=Mono_scaffold00225:64524-65968(-) / protein_length=447 / sequence_SO=supercontig / SO=protein_coding / is_pseudo=false
MKGCLRELLMKEPDHVGRIFEEENLDRSFSKPISDIACSLNNFHMVLSLQSSISISHDDMEIIYLHPRFRFFEDIGGECDKISKDQQKITHNISKAGCVQCGLCPDSDLTDDKAMAEMISKWYPLQHSIDAMCQDVQLEKNGSIFSRVADVQKSVMLKQWQADDSKLNLEEAEGAVGANKLCKKRLALIESQIRDAKRFKKMFGEWVTKPWMTNEEEIDIWNAAGIDADILEIENFGVSDKASETQVTLEELKAYLRIAEDEGSSADVIFNIKALIEREKMRLEKKSRLEAMSNLERYFLFDKEKDDEKRKLDRNSFAVSSKRIIKSDLADEQYNKSEFLVETTLRKDDISTGSDFLMQPRKQPLAKAECNQSIQTVVHDCEKNYPFSDDVSTEMLFFEAALFKDEKTTKYQSQMMIPQNMIQTAIQADPIFDSKKLGQEAKLRKL